MKFWQNQALNVLPPKSENFKFSAATVSNNAFSLISIELWQTYRIEERLRARKIDDKTHHWNEISLRLLEDIIMNFRTH